MTSIIVSSNALAHHERMIARLLEATTAKWPGRLTMAELPWVKKKGMAGTIARTPVEMVAEAIAA
jgi:hypothetical protein